MEDFRVIRTAIRAMTLVVLIMFGLATPAVLNFLKRDINVNMILRPLFDDVVDLDKAYPNLNAYFILLVASMLVTLKVVTTALFFYATTDQMAVHNPTEAICLSQTALILTIMLSTIDALSLFSEGGIYYVHEGLLEFGMAVIGLVYLVYRFVKLLKIEEAKIVLKNQGFGAPAPLPREDGRIRSRYEIQADPHVFIL